MRLSELNTGEKGVIVKVLGHGGFRKRIVEMGFIKGKTVEVLLNAPLRDPIKYKVMGYEISLRRQEAEMIEIISEQEAKEQAVQPDYHEGLGENMHLGEDELKQLALGKRRTINVALVGNPNCGKTSLFNIASGSHEHVGNYSGVTVDAKEGYFDFQGYHFRIVDLPGTYSLSAYSPEEIYVRRHIINETPDIIINVVDSSNLERNLYLTTQLIDMNVRMVIALNMYDELEEKLTAAINQYGRDNIFTISLEGRYQPKEPYDRARLLALGNVADVKDGTMPDYNLVALLDEHKDDMIGMYLEEFLKEPAGTREKKALYCGLDPLLNV